MYKQKNALRYIVEFLVIVTGVTVSFWGEEYRESLQNDEEEFKALKNLQIELDEIDTYCEERKTSYRKDFFKLTVTGVLRNTEQIIFNCAFKKTWVFTQKHHLCTVVGQIILSDTNSINVHFTC